MSDSQNYTWQLYKHIHVVQHICSTFACCCCCLSHKFDSTTTTLLQLIACFHATILIVLSFAHGATIKAKLWLEESPYRKHGANTFQKVGAEFQSRERNVVRFSAAVSGEERCVTTLKTAEQQTTGLHGLLCKSCQPGNIMTEEIPRFLPNQIKKNCYGGSFSATKCYPYEAWPSNLSATIRNVARVYPHTPMHTAEIWKNYVDFFLYFLKAFLSLNRDKYFALQSCFCVTIPFSLLLIKRSEMDPNVKPQTLVETFDQEPTTILSRTMMQLS